MILFSGNAQLCESYFHKIILLPLFFRSLPTQFYNCQFSIIPLPIRSFVRAADAFGGGVLVLAEVFAFLALDGFEKHFGPFGA